MFKKEIKKEHKQWDLDYPLEVDNVNHDAELDRQELFAGHIIKEELVISPEGFQKTKYGLVFEETSSEEDSQADTRRRSKSFDNSCDILPDISEDCDVNSCPKYSEETPSSHIISGSECGNLKFVKTDVIQTQIKAKPCILGVSNENISKCDKLEKQMNSDHMLTCYKEKSYSCHVCQKKFKRNKRLERHILTHIKDALYRCHICNKQFKVKMVWQLHMWSHSSKGIYSCCYCSKTFSIKNLWKTHMLTHANRILMNCDICTKTFKTMKSLESHMARHANERPLTCSICFKTFPKKETLQYHILTHGSNKSFRCNGCNEIFRTESQFKYHILLHARKRNFRCNICHKTYFRKYCFYRHMESHKKDESIFKIKSYPNDLSNKEYFICDICDKTYAVKKSLELHILNHINNKTMQYDSLKKEHLQNHIQSNTKDKCKDCNKFKKDI